MRVAGGRDHLDRGRLDTLVFRAWLFGIITFLEARARERIRRDPGWRDAISIAVAPSDPIPDYRCKMGAALPGLGRLAGGCRPRQSPI